MKSRTHNQISLSGIVLFMLVLSVSVLAMPVYSMKTLQVKKVVGLFDNGNYNFSRTHFNTSTNLDVGFIFYNPFNRSIPVQISDNNVVAGAGFRVPCYEVVVPPNSSFFKYSQSIFLSSPGSFTIPSANITYTLNNKTYSISTNSIPISATGKSYGVSAITTIYRCNGQSYSSSSYSSSSSLVINNGKIHVSTGMPDEIQHQIDQMNKQFQQINQQMNQMFNSMFPQQNQNPYQNYNPFAGSNSTSINNQSTNGIAGNNTSSYPANNRNSMSSTMNAPQAIPLNRLSGKTGVKGVNAQQKKSLKNARTLSLGNHAKDSEIYDKVKVVEGLRLILLLVLALLIVAFVVINNKSKKKQIENLEVVEEVSWVDYFKKIKKQIKSINELRKSKEYLKFKKFVDDFKKLIENDDFDPKVIDALNLFLYKDDVDELKKAIELIEKQYT